MRKICSFLITMLFLGVAAPAQVTPEPALPIISQPVKIIFDAAQGSGGLKDYSGDVYAHTGVITDQSTGGSDWKYAPAWGDNSAKFKLTRISANIYELQISPDIRNWYGVPEGEKILKMAFVFRSGAYKPGTTQYYEGKTSTGGDIFVDVYEASLAVGITAPANNGIVSRGVPVTLSAASTVDAELKLYLNSSLLKEETGKSVAVSYLFEESGNYMLKAEATADGNTVADSVRFIVKQDAIEEPMPSVYRKGINYLSDSSAALVLWAPYKEFVFVTGDFNEWQIDNNYQMKKDGDYYWLEINGLTPRKPYVFQYYIDSEIRIADPYTEQTSDPEDQAIPSVTYPGLVAYPSEKAVGVASVIETGQIPYNWEINDFIPPPVDQLVIYEVLIRDFTVQRTYQSVIDKLDYLKELNVNVLELMPVNEFEGNLSWGYNPSFYFAPDKYYGHRNDLKRLIDEAHKRGIAVVIDMVLNHSYGQSPLARMYLDRSTGRPAANNPWYNTQHNFQNPDAQWGYDFNHESEHTRALIDSVNSFWMKEYKIDGFRFDFTKGFSNTPYGPNDWGSAYDPARISNLKRMADEIWKRNENALVIFEHLSDNREEKELADYGILMWGNMNHAYTEAAKGNVSDLNWGLHTTRGWENPHLISYMESHDEERVVYRLLREGRSEGSYNTRLLPVALDRVELSSLFLLPLPGPKMIWQFGELGYDYSINTCANPAQVSNNCRLEPKPVLWSYYDQPNRKDVYKMMARLNYLKTNYEEFATPGMQVSLDGEVKWYRLSKNNNHVMAIGNFAVAERTVTVTFPVTGTWYDYFSNTTYIVENSVQTFTLPPGQFRLFSTRKFSDPFLTNSVNISSDVYHLSMYPNPATDVLNLQSAKNITGIEIINLTGQIVFKGTYSSNMVAIPLNGLPAGIHVVSVYQGDINTRHKIMIR